MRRGLSYWCWGTLKSLWLDKKADVAYGEVGNRHTSSVSSLAFSVRTLQRPQKRPETIISFAQICCSAPSLPPPGSRAHRCWQAQACLGRGPATIPCSPSAADTSSIPLPALLLPLHLALGQYLLDPILQPQGHFTPTISLNGRHP